MYGNLIVYGGKFRGGVVELGLISSYDLEMEIRPPSIRQWYYAHLVPMSDGQEPPTSIAEFHMIQEGAYILIYRNIVTLVTIFERKTAQVTLNKSLIDNIPHGLIALFGSIDGAKNVRRALP